MTDFDPTTNRIPFGLLTVKEQAALKAWPHGWEYVTRYDGYWHETDTPAWDVDVSYRGKPAPVVTSDWFNVYPQWPISTAYPTRKMADDIASLHTRIAVLRIDTCNGVSTAHLEAV